MHNCPITDPDFCTVSVSSQLSARFLFELNAFHWHQIQGRPFLLITISIYSTLHNTTSTHFSQSGPPIWHFKKEHAILSRVPCYIPIRSTQKHKSLQISSQTSATLPAESPTPLHISTKASSFIPLQGISAGQESSPHSFLPIAFHSIFVFVSVPSSQKTQPTTLEDKYVLPLHDAHRPMDATRKISIPAYLAANMTHSQPGAFVEEYIIVDIVQRRGECFELSPQRNKDSVSCHCPYFSLVSPFFPFCFL